MKLADGREIATDRPIDGGRYNVYDCPGEPGHELRVERGTVIPPTPSRLSHPLLSVDVDDGVTPMMVNCPDHDLMARSRFYRVLPVPSLFPVRMIWRKATEAERADERRSGGDHYAQGGLAREWTADKPPERPSWITSGRHG